MMLNESSMMMGPSDHNNMVVAVRIRPLSGKELAAGAQKCCKVMNGKVVAIAKAGISKAYLRSQQGSINEYQYDVAFDADSSQAEVYEQTAKPHIPAVVIDGYNVTVFAYGATGAGKTHTMMGTERSGEDNGSQTVNGIIPQSLVDIFSCIQQRRNEQTDRSEWRVSVSYLEVYNEQLFDLIGPGRQPLQVREDSQKGVVQVAGLSEVHVQDTNEVLDLLRLGNRNRKTESTAANQVSSRSHAVLQISVRYSTVDAYGNDLVRESKLSLIDLAGSERASATANRGIRLQEGANINKSLLALANCINALAENGTNKARRNVKYRDSKLTHLLKTSLEGDCKLIMIANVNPCDSVFEDSHNTLKYANRAKQIKIKPGTVQLQTQEVPGYEREARLRADNEAMRLELAHLKSLLGARPAAEVPDINTDFRHSHHQDTAAEISKNSSLCMSTSSSSFMTTDEVMDAEEGPLSISHDTADRRISKAAAAALKGLASSSSADDAVARIQELENMVLEMNRTRKCMEQLVASLEAQKREKEEQCQTQQQLVQSLQRKLREREQEVQSLREMVVHLRTRLESAGINTTFNEGLSLAPPASSSSASSSSLTANPDMMMEALGDMFSPIKFVNTGVPTTSSKRKSSSGRKSGGGGGGASAARKTAKRRQSQIPRPAFNYSTRRTSMLIPPIQQRQPLLMESDKKVLSYQEQQQPPSGSKRSYAMISEKENDIGDGNAGFGSRNSNSGSTYKRQPPPSSAARSTRRRESMLPMPSGGGGGPILGRHPPSSGMTTRTRSRMSLAPVGQRIGF